ncbi:MAG: hypothetical protein IT306_23555 [Chloroflexi bacterium]|nr:hypothetical protein [Chloroflexota bacterium]
MRLILSLGCLLLAVGALMTVPTDGRARAATDDQGVPELRQRGESTESLGWVLPQTVRLDGVTLPRTRAALLRERASRTWANDAVGVARLNAILATEGFRRSKLVLDRWIPRFDPGTGLLPTDVLPEGHLWAYGDTGSDLYPHLAIAAHLLEPESDPLFLNLLARERQLGPDVPDDVRVPGGQPLGLSEQDRIFGVAEYAKDGLLPMVDRLGPDPWLGRLVEIADRLLAASSVRTRAHGLVPADSTEVNGDVLQILARVYWATRDPKYLEAAGRISRTYTEEVFPVTTFLPPNRWDFVEKEPLDRRRFRLSDHGNEILPGLLEWHLAATLSGDPRASTDRLAIRRMLDRLADRARSPDGLWMRVIEIPSGRVDQEGFSDNWGYVSQAFLIQSLVERVAPDGDPEASARYREVAAKSLAGVTKYRAYAWQSGEMDGYADAIESALYMLHEIDDPQAAMWVDDQLGVLYGFQNAEGAVVERDLDGNFIRSTLNNAYRLTGGARLAPWSPNLWLGGVKEGGCLVLWAASDVAWSGSLVLDRPRHRDYLNMPYDYARLNKWLEWYTAEAGSGYRVEDSGRAATTVDGAVLIQGLPLTLAAGEQRTLKVCRDG